MQALPEADQRASSPPIVPAYAHQVEKASPDKLGSETEQLLDELQEQGGLSSAEVAQMRAGLTAASPQTRPLLERLLSVTVADRTQPNSEVPVAANVMPSSRAASDPKAPSDVLPSSSSQPKTTARRADVDFQDFFQVRPFGRTREVANDVVVRVSDLDWDDSDLSPDARRSVDRLAVLTSAVPPAAGEIRRDTPLLVPGKGGEVLHGGAERNSRNWQDHVHQAIDLLEEELAVLGDDADDAIRHEALLRMLHLIADDRSSAARSIKQLAPHEQEFWSHQLHGLALLLDHERIPSSRQRAAAAVHQLHTAIAKLSESCMLRLKNLAFCTQVDSYGRYTEFRKDAFKPGQEVLLYVEVENFSVEESSQGYETSFAGSYHVFNAMGQSVFNHAFPPSSELCRNRRRDLFIRYQVWLPKHLAPGRYTLELQIEDVKGKRFGQATREFTIAP